MARLRITLLLLALGIAIPAGLIVQRALASLDLENEFRHEAVARRLFDEMERSLSTFLLHEEARPIADYDTTNGGAFAEVDEPFLVGWFALDRAGQPRVVHARTDEASVLTAVSSWALEVASAEADGSGSTRSSNEIRVLSPSPALAAEAAAADGKAELRIGKKDAAQRKEQEARTTASPAPGSTQRLGKSGIADKDSAEAFEEKQSGTAYEILSSLNRAPDLRSARKSKQQVVAQAAPKDSAHSSFPSAERSAYPAASPPDPLPKPRPRTRSAVPASRVPAADATAVLAKSRARETEGRRADDLAKLGDTESESHRSAELGGLTPSTAPTQSAEAAERSARDTFKDSRSTPSTRTDRATRQLNELAEAPTPALEDRRPQSTDDAGGPSAKRALARRKTADLSYTIDPLIGRSTADGHVVLVRSVWRLDGAVRQGVVLDRAALASWLGDGVLAASGLGGRARLDFSDVLTHLAARGGEHRYVHRFAEPFDGLVAHLALDPLPGLGGPEPIYALSALLIGIAVIGLYAVQRGARTVVDYAQRRSDFVASVSHELKTPLTSIRMYGEMLRDGLVGNDAKREEYYATIADESERLTRLIDNVLEFSRLEQDRRALELVVGPLAMAVREVGEKLRAHVEREGFALRLELDEGLPAVRYDRDALTQVVFNLVDNALKYAASTERRDIVIALRGQGSSVELCVRDFGPGVSPRSLRHIFEPFYRGGDELTRTAKGTGIGLALVHDLAAAMGASVRGANRPDGGFEVAVAFQAQA